MRKRPSRDKTSMSLVSKEYLVLLLLVLFVVLPFVLLHSLVPLSRDALEGKTVLVSSPSSARRPLYAVAVISSVKNALVHLRGLSREWEDEFRGSADLVYFVGRDDSGARTRNALPAMESSTTAGLATFFLAERLDSLKSATNNCSSSDTLVGYFLGKSGIRPTAAAPLDVDLTSFPFHGRS